MPATAARKHRTERIQARVTDEAKTLLESAAAMQGVSLSEFVLSSALQKAFETVQAQTNVRLSVRDSAAFAEALNDPAQPNEALRAAHARHIADVGR